MTTDTNENTKPLVFIDVYNFIEKFKNTDTKNRGIVLNELNKIHAELTEQETKSKTAPEPPEGQETDEQKSRV